MSTPKQKIIGNSLHISSTSPSGLYTKTAPSAINHHHASNPTPPPQNISSVKISNALKQDVHPTTSTSQMIVMNTPSASTIDLTLPSALSKTLHNSSGYKNLSDSVSEHLDSNFESNLELSIALEFITQKILPSPSPKESSSNIPSLLPVNTVSILNDIHSSLSLLHDKMETILASNQSAHSKTIAKRITALKQIVNCLVY